MKSTVLRFYVHENRKVHSLLAYEWLLEHAKKMGIHGGSAFRAIAGYGRHGILHEQHFFELAGDLAVVTEFIVSEAEAEALLDLVQKEKIHIVVARWSVDFLVFDGKP
jgi:PII-like signaling protein